MSRIGKLPISLPDKVKVSVNGSEVLVEGPKGKLTHSVPDRISVTVDAGAVSVSRNGDDREQKALHGLTRSLINNMVKGTNEGFQKKLVIKGVGFKCAVQGKVLNLSLGFSHPVNYEIPEDVKISVANGSEILIEGICKQRVGAVAADVRRYYPPEPYKGKGIRYEGEVIRMKEGKTAQK